jgi:nucleoside-diphosphate-sugar epimerase
MRVFVAGATGVVGWRAVRDLVAAGHQVTAMARSEAKAAQARQLGAVAVQVDLWDADRLAAAVAGHDVVCNLATHIPSMGRAGLPGAWSENDRIRSEGSIRLVDAALAGGAGRYVQESVTLLYVDSGDRWLDEGAPVDPTVTTGSALIAEAQAGRFTEAGGVGVVLRFAQFYSADSSYSRLMVTAVRRRLAPNLGPRQAYQSSIHADDAARAVVSALDLPPGVTNVADDDPVTREDYARVVAAAVGAGGAPRHLGAIALLGGRKVDALVRSQRIANSRLRDTGWVPTFRTVREGWPVVAAELASSIGASN